PGGTAWPQAVIATVPLAWLSATMANSATMIDAVRSMTPPVPAECRTLTALGGLLPRSRHDSQQFFSGTRAESIATPHALTGSTSGCFERARERPGAYAAGPASAPRRATAEQLHVVQHAIPQPGPRRAYANGPGVSRCTVPSGSVVSPRAAVRPIHRMFPGCPRSGKIGHAEGGVVEGVGVAVYEKADLLWLRKFLARGRMECRVPQADDQRCRATVSANERSCSRCLSTPYEPEPFCANLFRDLRFVSLEERERQSSPN